MVSRCQISNMIRTKLTSTEMIKPSSPTPTHLKHYNLSSIDQVLYRNYIPIVFFFPNNMVDDHNKISHHLKHSLSEALTQYYPFSGRLTSRGYVDCTDEGIEFQEAQIECKLSEILKKYDDLVELDLLFPCGLVWGTFDNNSSLVVVRVSNFDCGGIAVAVCLSHLVADACTFATFMNYWAAVSRQSGEQVLPRFVSSHSRKDDFVTMQESQIPKKNCVTRRLVFKNIELANLKAKVAVSDGPTPTRVEFLSALLYKSAIATLKSKSGSFRPSVLLHPVNMRPKIVPQLPKTTVGNWIWHPKIRTTSESESSLNVLIDQIKKGKTQIEGMRDLDGKEFRSQILESIENNYMMYVGSSMCNLELHKVNFGWGNPVQVALGGIPFDNGFILMDTPNQDGIEVLLSFEEEESVRIHLNRELQTLASFI